MRNLRTTGVAWLLGVLVPLLAQAHPPLDAQSKRRLDGLLTSTVPCADNVVCDLQAGTTIGGSPIGGGGGAPTTADYLTGTSQAGLSAEIVFGAAVANQCVTGVSAGAITRAQPDFSWLTGTATDAQIPNTITVDLATVATTANAGDSATAFFSSGTIEDARIDGSAESDEVTGLADSQISDTLTASTSSTAAANDSDTSIATTAFVQQEIDDGDLLSDNCILENDSTPIPDSCVGDGTDGGGGGGGNSVETNVTCTQGQGWCTAVVTGQAWVAAGSEIVCGASGSDLAAFVRQPIADLKSVGVGFTIKIYNPDDVSGVIPVHCIGV